MWQEKVVRVTSIGCGSSWQDPQSFWQLPGFSSARERAVREATPSRDHQSGWQSLQGSAFPGRAWERGAAAFFRECGWRGRTAVLVLVPLSVFRYVRQGRRLPQLASHVRFFSVPYVRHLGGVRPMRRDRPTVVLVMAILNFVLGGLGLCGMLCLAGGIGLFAAAAGNAPPPPPGQPDFREMVEAFKSVPGYIPFMIASLVVGLVVLIALIVSGFGLLSMRPWARWICIVYGVYAILSALVGLVYNLAVVGPALEEYARQHGPAAADSTGMNNPIMNVFSTLIGMAYGIALLIVMFLPHVSAAFAGKWRRPVLEMEDYYDEGYGAEDNEPRHGRRLDDREGPGEHGIRPADDAD
jgi:hypothetical protein